MTTFSTAKKLDGSNVLVNSSADYEPCPQAKRFEEDHSHEYEIIPNPSIYHQPRPRMVTEKNSHYDVPKSSHIHKSAVPNPFYESFSKGIDGQKISEEVIYENVENL